MTRLALALSLLAACGGGGGSTTQRIPAAQGGTVSLDDTRLDIPANALGEDTDVSIEIAALADFGALADARDRVLVIEPAGTTLAVPATITLDPGAPAIEQDQLVSIAQFVDGAWVTVAESGAEVGSGGLVTANIDLFAPTAVVVRDAPQGPTGTIAGTVFHLYTEQPLPGIEFELRDGQSVLGTATSDAAGQFEFADVPVGPYTVHSNIDPADNCFDDPVDKDATVSENETVEVFFGFVPGPCSP
jgi:hypothetical protein